VREKYLKPDGHMFPSHATMYWALVNDEAERELREKEYHDVSCTWAEATESVGDGTGHDCCVR